MEPIRPDRDESIAARGDEVANGRLRWILALAALLSAVLLGWYLWWERNAEPETAPVLVAAESAGSTRQGSIAPPAADSAPTIQHPLDTAQTAEPLPAVDASDSLLARALADLVTDKQLSTLFFTDAMVRRIVATVDNLPRQHAPVNMWPLRPVGSWFDTVAAGGGLVVGPKNAARYARYVKLVKAVDAEQAAAVYRQLYPLFQQAYQDLGFPSGYFNDRLVAAIDDLLATPEIAEPLRMEQVKVRYQFADPELERRSAGQKIMLRIGPENALVVKAKLRELRQALAKSAK